MNTLNKWPHVHICSLSIDCWCEWWLYGAPMRIHYKKKCWTIPGPLLWVSDYRSRKMWDWGNPVKRTTGPNPTASTDEVSPSPTSPVSREG